MTTLQHPDRTSADQPEQPSVTVNGSTARLDGVPTHTTTLDWLREQGLTGAKEGCAEGECGACSVLVARPAPLPDDAPGDAAPTEWTAVNACLVPVLALDGQEVVTSEGLMPQVPGGAADLHPVQREMADRGGSQCGYCTPGFVCSMAAEFYRPGRCEHASGTGDAEHGPNGFDLHALSGNLCRCTGYRPIRDAAYALGSPASEDVLAARRSRPAPDPVATHSTVADRHFVRPADLAATHAELVAHPDARLVAGATDWGVEVNLRGARAPYVVAIDRVPELRELSVTEDAIRIGAALTLTEVERRLAGRVPLLDAMFGQFASRLIRNGATIGGNLGTGSPIGDTPPALLALEASLVLSSARGDREVPLADYFTGYRETVREADELIRAVVVPMPLAPATAFHKIAKRRFDDISSVAVGYAVEVSGGVAGGVVSRVAIGLGGVAATPLRARATEQALLGRPWNEETVRAAAKTLAAEGTPMDDHRASASYRSAMLGQSLLRFFHEAHTRDQEVGA